MAGIPGSRGESAPPLDSVLGPPSGATAGSPPGGSLSPSSLASATASAETLPSSVGPDIDNRVIIQQPWRDRHANFQPRWENQLAGAEVSIACALGVGSWDHIKLIVPEPFIKWNVMKVNYVMGAIRTYTRKPFGWKEDGVCNIVQRYAHGAFEVRLDPEMWHQILRNCSPRYFDFFKRAWINHAPTKGSWFFRPCQLCQLENGEVTFEELRHKTELHFTLKLMVEAYERHVAVCKAYEAEQQRLEAEQQQLEAQQMQLAVEPKWLMDVEKLQTLNIIIQSRANDADAIQGLHTGFWDDDEE